jgi:D-aminopeptidase
LALFIYRNKNKEEIDMKGKIRRFFISGREVASYLMNGKEDKEQEQAMIDYLVGRYKVPPDDIKEV